MAAARGLLAIGTVNETVKRDVFSKGVRGTNFGCREMRKLRLQITKSIQKTKKNRQFFKTYYF